ncbi:MAG: ECF-type sigma factor [Xanthomonadales bacterium]|nr:ECF-type sigma factor [Xanthomonadales bacterium]
MKDEDITSLVVAISDGDTDAYEKLFTQVYAELKLLARSQLRGASSPTLNTTGLVHDVYLKLACPASLTLSNRKHFFVLAAKAMRQIVIDHARARRANKRVDGASMLPLDLIAEPAAAQIAPDRLLLLDRALSDLEEREPHLSVLIELRFFGGMELGDIAALEEVSERTLNRTWRRARAELYAALYA